MKKLIFSIWVVISFASLAQAQNGKLDSYLNKQLLNNPGSKVRAIVQFVPGTAADVASKVTGSGGMVIGTFRTFPVMSITVPVSALGGLTNNPNVAHISFDAPTKASDDVSNVASGAAAATATYKANGYGIGVAVIDSGIANVPDLQNVTATVDFVQSGTVRVDPFGHGTHVAGILAGSGAASNGQYAGIVPQATLVNLRVLDGNGAGYTSAVIAAIDWAVNNKNALGSDGTPLNIRVINLSLGHLPYEPAATDPLAAACRMAVKSGIVVVAAAGNFGRDSYGNTVYGAITSPGTEPSVITVGAMNDWNTVIRSDDTVAPYSSRGPAMGGIIKPDILAPGSRIIAPMSPNNTLVTLYPQLQVNSNYMRLSGTSMATPNIAGAVAMMLQMNPGLSPNAVKADLMYTAEKWQGSVLATGAGYVNTAGAVNLAMNTNTTASTGQYWITKNGNGLLYSNLIAGFPAVWGQTIVWSDTLYGGNFALYNQMAWGQTIVWGDSTTWATTIVWETDLNALSTTISGQTIVWDLVNATTIVWDSTIVWDAL